MASTIPQYDSAIHGSLKDLALLANGASGNDNVVVSVNLGDIGGPQSITNVKVFEDTTSAASKTLMYAWGGNTPNIGDVGIIKPQNSDPRQSFIFTGGSQTVPGNWAELYADDGVHLVGVPLLPTDSPTQQEEWDGGLRWLSGPDVNLKPYFEESGSVWKRLVGPNYEKALVSKDAIDLWDPNPIPSRGSSVHIKGSDTDNSLPPQVGVAQPLDFSTSLYIAAGHTGVPNFPIGTNYANSDIVVGWCSNHRNTCFQKTGFLDKSLYKDTPKSVGIQFKKTETIINSLPNPPTLIDMGSGQLEFRSDAGVDHGHMDNDVNRMGDSIIAQLEFKDPRIANGGNAFGNVTKFGIRTGLQMKGRWQEGSQDRGYTFNVHNDNFFVDVEHEGQISLDTITFNHQLFAVQNTQGKFVFGDGFLESNPSSGKTQIISGTQTTRKPFWITASEVVFTHGTVTLPVSFNEIVATPQLGNGTMYVFDNNTNNAQLKIYLNGAWRTVITTGD